MLHLISSNGQLTTPSIVAQDESSTSLAKCLRFIRNVLQLEAKLSAFESSSASFQLLQQMSGTQPYIEFKGKIFIPILRPDAEAWGFLEISPETIKPSPVKIRKAIQAVKDMIEPHIDDEPSPISEAEIISHNFSLLVYNSDLESGHRMSTNIFHEDKYTSFINLSEWLEQDDSFSLKSLREFSDSLLFVPEVFNLNKKQRAILALYAMLPDQLKNSSLVLCTKYSFSELSKSLLDESNFISSFSTKKTPLNKYIEKRRLF